ncbi:ANTAR domain-containing protein [Streptomyces sp. NPDC048484]|uniref:ANTAR domain-containing protein n=1 Tax=Streptomyces sp. NPDC048484 TaxID=3155146 RepID=UPI00343FB802
MKVETHSADGRTTVTAVGEIDMDTCPELQLSLNKALSESARGVDLELSGVDFCDCSGLNALLLIHRRAASEGKTVVVRSASPAIERLLTLSQTSSLFASTGDADPDTALRNQNPRPGAAHSPTEESPLSDTAIDAVDTDADADAEQDLRLEVVQLKRAMQTRPVIDLARGVLMATFGLSPEDAWSVLVTVSQNANIKLRHLAEGTVAAVRGESLPEPVRQQLSAAVAELSARRPADARATDARATDTGGVGPVPQEALLGPEDMAQEGMPQEADP